MYYPHKLPWKVNVSEQENQNVIAPVAEAAVALAASVVVATAVAPEVVLAAGVIGVVSLAAFAKDAYDYASNDNSQEMMYEFNARQHEYAKEFAYMQQVVNARMQINLRKHIDTHSQEQAPSH